MIPPRFPALAALFFIGILDALPAQELTLGAPFGPHMVLQRETRAPVFGTAVPGVEVTVKFAGQEKRTQAGPEGRWQVELAPMPTSAQPRGLLVSAGKSHILLEDVLVGEVWVCAGQSNMEWPVSKEKFASETLPKANRETLRLLNWSFAGQYFSKKPFGKAEVPRQSPVTFYEGRWETSSSQTAAPFSAVAYHFGVRLQEGLQAPVGLVHLAVGGSPTEAWICRETLAAHPSFAAMTRGDWMTNPALDEWCQQRARDNLTSPGKEGLSIPGDDLGWHHPYKPGFLWQAGPARLLPMAIRGVIWYQGESNSLNARRVAEHGQLFPLLVADWRERWQQGAFPFYFCQLSGISTEKGYHSELWPEFRDQQRRFLETLPNTGFAVTHDLGDRVNIHPTNKRDVGERLARVALAKTYGQSIEWSGPAPLRLTVEGDALRLYFDHADGLRTSDGAAPISLEVAGADGVFHPATGVIEKETILVHSPKVPQPVQVRHGWQPFTVTNLVNAAGLPCSTFLLALTPP